MHVEKSAFADVPATIIARRRLTQMYHSNVINHCPACGHTHWTIGRSTAECAFCETALPLSISISQPAAPLFFYRGTKTAAAA